MAQPPGDDMSCKEFVELVTEYLEGTLPADARGRFERHLEECDGCSVYLDQIRLTIETLGALSEETISRDARDHLLEAFQTWKR